MRATQPAAPETGYFHFGTSVAPSGSTIGINSRYLTLDGKPWLPVMGEFHFTRFPQPRLEGRTREDEGRRREHRLDLHLLEIIMRSRKAISSGRATAICAGS